jgi:hypothetical protein
MNPLTNNLDKIKMEIKNNIKINIADTGLNSSGIRNVRHAIYTNRGLAIFKNMPS